MAHDNPIPGFNTRNTINLRLWAAKPDKEFDLEAFNTGDYVQAILAKQRAETLSSVLYPDDRTYEGKELRLKQQHFFVSATLQACPPGLRAAASCGGISAGLQATCSSCRTAAWPPHQPPPSACASRALLRRSGIDCGECSAGCGAAVQGEQRIEPRRL